MTEQEELIQVQESKKVKKPKVRRVISNRVGNIGLPDGVVLKKGVVTTISDEAANVLAVTCFKDFITVID